MAVEVTNAPTLKICRNPKARHGYDMSLRVGDTDVLKSSVTGLKLWFDLKENHELLWRLQVTFMGVRVEGMALVDGKTLTVETDKEEG